MMLSFKRFDLLCCFFQLVAKIVRASHYSSHLLAQTIWDIESTRFDIKRLERVVEDVESSLADNKFVRKATMLTRNEAI